MRTDLKDNYWQITPDKPLALQLAKRLVSEYVFDAVRLEGINYTLPEVKTLLDGITVGGHKNEEQDIVINQGKAWKHLFKIVQNKQFNLSAKVACEIHKIAAKEEAMTWGKFRNTGVSIAGTDYLPPDPRHLDELFSKMIRDAEKYNDIYDKAFFVFLNMSRTQYFHDVNKRTGRFMMNGILLDKGYPPINVRANRQQEFNEKMIEFYNTGEMKPMNLFLRSCMDPKIKEIMKSNTLSR